jgi:hypothetical protein
MERVTTDQVIKSLIPALAAWILTLIIEKPKVKGVLQEIDAHTFLKQRKAMRSVKRAGKNAASNRAWLAAGAAAMAIGIGLMAKAATGTRRK